MSTYPEFRIFKTRKIVFKLRTEREKKDQENQHTYTRNISKNILVYVNFTVINTR